MFDEKSYEKEDDERSIESIRFGRTASRNSVRVTTLERLIDEVRSALKAHHVTDQYEVFGVKLTKRNGPDESWGLILTATTTLNSEEISVIEIFNFSAYQI